MSRQPLLVAIGLLMLLIGSAFVGGASGVSETQSIDRGEYPGGGGLLASGETTYSDDMGHLATVSSRNSTSPSADNRKLATVRNSRQTEDQPSQNRPDQQVFTDSTAEDSTAHPQTTAGSEIRNVADAHGEADGIADEDAPSEPQSTDGDDEAPTVETAGTPEVGGTTAVASDTGRTTDAAPVSSDLSDDEHEIQAMDTTGSAGTAIKATGDDAATTTNNLTGADVMVPSPQTGSPPIFQSLTAGSPLTRAINQFNIRQFWRKPAAFETEINASSVSAGNDITANVTITNTGDQAGDATIQVSDEATILNTTTLSLNGQTSTTITVTRETAVDDIGTVTLTANSSDTTTTTAVNVTDPEPPTVSAVQRTPARTNDTVQIAAAFDNGSVPIENARVTLAADFTAFTHSLPVENPTGDTAETTVTFDVTELPADGNYTPQVVATGPTGQTDINTTDPVTVDTTPPTLQLSTANLTTNGTLRIAPREPVTLNDSGITITTETRADRSPHPTDIPDSKITDPVTIPFNSTVVGDNETFTVEVTATDRVGNRDTHTLTATVTNHTLSADETARIEPTNDTTISVTANDSLDRRDLTAAVQRSDTAPPGTSLTAAQVGGGFLTITTSGLTESARRNVTVEFALDGVAQETVSAFENSSLRVLTSAADERAYHPVETTYNPDNHTVTATANNVSQFGVAGIDTTEPSVTSTAVAPSRSVAPTDGPVNISYEYRDNKTGIDVTQTTLSADVASERNRTTVGRNSAWIEIDQLSGGETIPVVFRVTDNAGNSQTQTETISVDPGGEDDVADHGGTPSVDQVRSTLGLLTPERHTAVSLAAAEPAQDGLVLTTDDAETVDRLRFTQESLSGRVSVTEYGDPPQSLADALTESAAQDIDSVETGSEYGEQGANIEVVSLANITPTIEGRDDSAATVEFTINNSSINDPERLAVLTETDSAATQQPAWQLREPTIQASGTDEVRLQVAVDSFSLFAIVDTAFAPQQPDGAGETETTSTEDDSTDIQQPILIVVSAGIIVGLLLSAPFARRLRRTTEEDVDPEDTEFEWDPLDDS